jgi:sarcosine oxidase delta subunit
LDTYSEEWRHLCECRDWLRRGVRTAGQMRALKERITKARNAEAAERLHLGMIAERDRRNSTPTKGDV